MIKVKEAVLSQFNYCRMIAENIIEHGASEEIIKYVKKFAEIESPMTGEIDVAWIRINWGDIYIFIYMDEDAWRKNGTINLTGKMCYQFDPCVAYGAELIDTESISEFMEKLDELTEEEILKHHYVEDYSDDVPKAYIPYNS